MKKGVIDRFEGKFAIIEIDGKMQEFSLTILPEGARAGDVVIIEGNSLSLDRITTAEQQKKIQKLMDEVWED